MNNKKSTYSSMALKLNSLHRIWEQCKIPIRCDGNKNKWLQGIRSCKTKLLFNEKRKLNQIKNVGKLIGKKPLRRKMIT